MKKSFLFLMFAPLAFVFFYFVSCNEPVFYIVANEPPLIKPRIDGSPTKLVDYEIDNRVYMYVASGNTLFWYYNDIWSSRSFSSRVRDIAATSKYIYVCLESPGEMLIRAEPTKDASGGSEWTIKHDWQTIQTGNMDVQRILAAGDNLYISSVENLGSVSQNFPVSYIGGSGVSVSPVTLSNLPVSGFAPSMLIGCAMSGSNVFLCSTNSIFHTTSSNPGTISYVKDSIASDGSGKLINRNLTGIINPGNVSGTVFAINYDGYLYTVTSAGLIPDAIASFSDGRSSTGALAVYTFEDNLKLLLAGRQDIGYAYNTGYTFGFVEIEIDSAMTGVKTNKFKEPGTEGPSTVDNRDHFISSIGKNPVNYLHQTASNNRLFASTQKKGVWSYKIREDKLQWNAEE